MVHARAACFCLPEYLMRNSHDLCAVYIIFRGFPEACCDFSTVTFSAGLHRDCRRVLNTPGWVLVGGAQRGCFSVITVESHRELASSAASQAIRRKALHTIMLQKPHLETQID